MSKVQAVIFDWAGTMVDFGSCAPMGVFVEVFKSFGVDITISEARGPMGMAKWDHIKAVGTLPRVSAAWEQAKGMAFSDADVDALYEAFVPRNVEIAGDYADLIPGVADVVAELRKQGIKIGSSTGYTRDIMANIIPKAAEQGYEPDCIVCFGDTPSGRPSPLMIYENMIKLNVWPASNVVKVDDTVVGIEAGVAAGCPTVGISLTGNLVGLSEAELAALPAEEVNELRDRATKTLKDAGADYVIDSVADLMPVIRDINKKLGA